MLTNPCGSHRDRPALSCSGPKAALIWSSTPGARCQEIGLPQLVQRRRRFGAGSRGCRFRGGVRDTVAARRVTALAFLRPRDRGGGLGAHRCGGC
jgi:hypothetical protein